ncbi:MAG: 3-phosphoshikimate 1-carboxyvinyltransferase, partial [Eubacteriales bacterium]|nr:3-phosphoshikimate 1-carboxyvinyltransferase [Eubacteriales bacterium]
MIATIRPSRAEGTMTAPPSKSMAHRMIFCAGLAKGISTIRNLDASEDILATMDCLRALGAEIQFEDRTAVIRGTDPQNLLRQADSA